MLDLNALQVGCFTFKVMNNLLPAAFTNLCMLNSIVRSHEIRSSSNIHVVGFLLNVRKASIKCHGTSVCNTLPLAVRLSTIFTIVKRCLQTLLITQY